MINSKQIKDTNIKAIKFREAEEEGETVPEWNKKLQKVASKLERFFYKYKIPFLWRSEALDDLSMFPLKQALEYIWDRFVRVTTFSHFRQQFKSGIDHFKQGYNSYDFDSVHAMDLFLWKLERVAKCLDTNDRHYGDREHAKKIREAIQLINRVIEDEYVDEFDKEVAEKYGENIHWEARTSGTFGFLNKDKGPFKNKHCGSMSMSQREKWTPELDKEIHKAERAKYKKAHNKRMREWKKALKIIENDFFSWWD